MYLIVINPFIVIKFKQYFNNKFDEIIMLILFLIHLSYMAIMFNYSAHSGSIYRIISTFLIWFLNDKIKFLKILI